MQRWQRLSGYKRHGHIADHAGRVDLHNAADLVIQQVVNFNLPLHDFNARVVGHLHVVKDAANDGRRGVLIALDDFNKAATEERVGLRVNVPACKWVIVNRLIRKQLVAAAAEQELMQDRRPGPVNVNPHIGFGDRNLLHRRVGGVFVIANRSRITAALHVLLIPHVRIRTIVKVHYLVFVNAHGDNVGGAHRGAVADDVKIIVSPRVAVDEELLGRDGLNAQLAVGVAAHHAHAVKLRQDFWHRRKLCRVNLLPCGHSLLRHSLRGVNLLLHGGNGVIIWPLLVADDFNAF